MNAASSALFAAAFAPADDRRSPPQVAPIKVSGRVVDGQGVIVTLHIEGDFHAFRAAVIQLRASFLRYQASGPAYPDRATIRLAGKR